MSLAVTIHIVGLAAHAETERVCTLMREYAALPHVAGRWLTVEQDLAALPHPFVAPSGALLLATDGVQPLGCGGLVALSPGVGEIKRVYVRPVARGRGVGEALTVTLLAEAKRLGFHRVRLDTAPELVAAQALYSRLGFVRIPPYRDGLLTDAVCFERPVA